MKNSIYLQHGVSSWACPPINLLVINGLSLKYNRKFDYLVLILNIVQWTIWTTLTLSSSSWISWYPKMLNLTLKQRDSRWTLKFLVFDEGKRWKEVCQFSEKKLYTHHNFTLFSGRNIKKFTTVEKKKIKLFC